MLDTVVSDDVRNFLSLLATPLNSVVKLDCSNLKCEFLAAECNGLMASLYLHMLNNNMLIRQLSDHIVLVQ